MIITKADLLTIMKKLMLESKQNTSPEYKEGYSDGIFDLFNTLNDKMPVKVDGK